MRKTINCLCYFVLVIGLAMASCQSKSKKETVLVQDRALLFKQWVKDTVDKTKAQPELLSKGLVKSQFILDADSLTLSDFKAYEFKSRDKIENIAISNVVLLLKEYNELPKDSCILSFDTETSFFPSMVDGLKYDFDFELKNILVRTSHIYIQYKYISGRLSGKRVYKLSGDIVSKDYDLYDFDWDGDRLIKRKLHGAFGLPL